MDDFHYISDNFIIHTFPFHSKFGPENNSSAVTVFLMQQHNIARSAVGCIVLRGCQAFLAFYPGKLQLEGDQVNAKGFYLLFFTQYHFEPKRFQP